MIEHTPDLLGGIIGVGSIVLMAVMFKYADVLSDGNIEKERNK